MDLPDPDKSRAVLIGASQFIDPELPDLPAVRNNLQALADSLCDPALWGLREAGCRVVADPMSTGKLLDPIHDEAAAAEDTLIIYYAGHGLVHPRRLELLLAVVGSTPGKTHTAVRYDDVRDKVIDSPAARRVVILDCCFSGRALGGMADPTAAVTDQAIVEGTYLLASAPPNQQALSPPGETYTAFTGVLLNLFAEGVPYGPERLALNRIYREVCRALRRRGQPMPQLRVDNTADELTLVRNRWHDNPETPSLDLRSNLPGTHYQLSDVIASGGSFPIHSATDTTTGQTVVAKPLPSITPSIERTLRTVARFDHPGIVRVLDIVVRDTPVVVMEYIDGQTLSAILRSHGPMEPLRALDIACRVCAALDYGHQHGVIHGEINSDNVMLTRDH